MKALKPWLLRLLAAGLGASLSVSAAGAAGGGDAERNLLDASKKGVRLTLPQGMVAKPPTLTAPQLNAANARKVASARAWGLQIREANLQPSIWLTPQQPYLPSGAQLNLTRDIPNNPVYAATPEFPYGHIQMGLGTVGLKDVPSDPRDWWLIECVVSGANNYGISASLRTTPGVRTEGANTPRRGVARAGNLLTVLIEPSAERTRYVGIGSAGAASRDNHWTFGGCEITAIRL